MHMQAVPLFTTPSLNDTSTSWSTILGLGSGKIWLSLPSQILSVQGCCRFDLSLLCRCNVPSVTFKRPSIWQQPRLPPMSRNLVPKVIRLGKNWMVCILPVVSSSLHQNSIFDVNTTSLLFVRLQQFHIYNCCKGDCRLGSGWLIRMQWFVNASNYASSWWVATFLGRIIT